MAFKFYLSILLISVFVTWPSTCSFCDDKRESDPKCAEAEVQPSRTQKSAKASIFPKDSTKTKVPIENPSYDPAGPGFVIGLGIVALYAGAISVTALLVISGVLILLGITMLLFYKRLKNFKPFNVRGSNIVGKILLALFFFLFMLALVGAIILVFITALTLLISALLSSVVSPVVTGLVIIGAGALWMLIKIIRYLIKKRRYTKSRI